MVHPYGTNWYNTALDTVFQAKFADGLQHGGPRVHLFSVQCWVNLEEHEIVLFLLMVFVLRRCFL